MRASATAVKTKYCMQFMWLNITDTGLLNPGPASGFVAHHAADARLHALTARRFKCAIATTNVQ